MCRRFRGRDPDTREQASASRFCLPLISKVSSSKDPRPPVLWQKERLFLFCFVLKERAASPFPSPNKMTRNPQGLGHVPAEPAPGFLCLWKIPQFPQRRPQEEVDLGGGGEGAGVKVGRGVVRGMYQNSKRYKLTLFEFKTL